MLYKNISEILKLANLYMLDLASLNLVVALVFHYKTMAN